MLNLGMFLEHEKGGKETESGIGRGSKRLKRHAEGERWPEKEQEREGERKRESRAR